MGAAQPIAPSGEEQPSQIDALRQELEEQLRATQEALVFATERANRVQSEFVANVSHEVRTPLNVILGYSELLREQMHDEQQKRYLEAITSSAHTLMGLINNILDLSKLEFGRLDLNTESVNIRQFLHDTYNVFALQMKQKHLESQIEIDNSVPVGLVLDETRLRQILFNIIGNAVKFTEKGFVRVAAYLMERPATDKTLSQTHDLVIDVADSGIGILDSKQAGIFRAFAQGDASSTRKHSGMGLGLAITKRLLEQMNGSITVHSTIGKGSVFRVTLHDVTVVSSARIIAESQQQQLPNGISFGDTTVLIADDIEVDRTLLTDILQQFQIHVLQAANGRQAVEFARKHEPKAIFTSLSMSDVNGDDIAFIIKNEKHLGHIPIIAITSAHDRTAVSIALKTYSASIKKPFQKRDVVSALLHILPYTAEAESLKSAEALQQSDSRSIDNGNDSSHREKGQPLNHEQLDELLPILQNESMRLWSHLRATLLFDEIEDFALQLTKLGQQYNVRVLAEFGGILGQQAKMCDMKHLPTTMERFPLIVGGLTMQVIGKRQQHE